MRKGSIGILPDSLKCEICENIWVYDCNAMNNKICRFCCDKYQLSNKSIDKCLKCKHLSRDIGYEVKVSSGILISHEYRNQYVFDSNINSTHLKTVELYERLGVDTINDKYNLAIQYSDVNRYQDALDLFNKLLKKKISNDGKGKIYEEMGDILLKLQKVTEAKDNYVKSLDYGNSSPTIYRRLGETYNILKEYNQSIHYHEKALSRYFSNEWVNNDDEHQDDNDFIYFTNYFSLAMGYANLNNHKKAIENANAFLSYYGSFEDIKKRYFTKTTIFGDSFMPESITSMYKLLSLTYRELNDFVKAKDNIKNARILDVENTEMAHIEGFIDGKIDNNDTECELKRVRHELIEKDRALMVLLQNQEGKTIKNYYIGEVNVESKYHIENSGTIGNQVIGDRGIINNGVIPIEEIKTILSEVSKNLGIIGNEDTKKHIEEINESVKSKKFSDIKLQLSNLLVSVTAGCITNNTTEILKMISNVVTKL